MTEVITTTAAATTVTDTNHHPQSFRNLFFSSSSFLISFLYTECEVSNGIYIHSSIYATRVRVGKKNELENKYLTLDLLIVYARVLCFILRRKKLNTPVCQHTYIQMLIIFTIWIYLFSLKYLITATHTHRQSRKIKSTFTRYKQQSSTTVNIYLSYSVINQFKHTNIFRK